MPFHFLGAAVLLAALCLVGPVSSLRNGGYCNDIFEPQDQPTTWEPPVYCLYNKNETCGPHGTPDETCQCSCRCDEGYAGLKCDKTAATEMATTPFGLAWTMKRRDSAAGIALTSTLGARGKVEEFTIEFWFKANYPFLVSWKGEHTLFEFRSPTSARRPFQMSIGYRQGYIQVVALAHRPSYTDELVMPLKTQKTKVLLSNRPYHIAVTVQTATTFSGDTDQIWSLFVDGIHEDTALFYTRQYFDDKALFFGTCGSAGAPKCQWSEDWVLIESEFVNGIYLDEVRIWNRSLVQDEILQVMYKKLNNNEEGLMVHYDFDDGDADIISNKVIGNEFFWDGAVLTNDTAPDDRLVSPSITSLFWPSYDTSFVPTTPKAQSAVLPTLIGIGHKGAASPNTVEYNSPSVTNYGATATIWAAPDGKEYVYLIGGAKDVNPSRLPDGLRLVYKMDFAERRWQNISATTNMDLLPDGLVLHSTTLYKDKIYIIGGSSSQSVFATFDLTTEKFANLDASRWELCRTGALGAHSATLIDNILWVFGGSVGGLVPRNDWTWLNLDTMECGSILQPAGSTADQWPEPRFLHAAHLIPGTANIMIYGGLRRIDDNARLADVWVYDTAAGTWEGPFRDGIPPIKLWGSYSSVGENLVIYGGTAGFDLFTLFTTAINLTDNYLERDSILVFKYDGTLREKIAWRYLSTDTISGGIRPARFAHSSTTFPDQRGIFVTGGFDVAPRVDSHRGQSGDIWFGANFVYFFTGCYKGYQPSQPGDPFAKCSPCQPGHYQDTAPLSSAIQLDVELIPQCLPCPAGEYASEIASIECMLVPDGYYSLGGASAPSPCPSDRPYTNLLGATSDSACTNVKAGADNVGAIVGGVVGAVVALAAIGAVVGGIFYRRYKKLKENAAFVAPIVIDETAFNISFLKRSDLELGDELGQGSFGTVYKGLYKDREVACKVSKPGMNEAVEDFLREAEVMMQIDPHPNVLQLIGVCVAGGSAMVVLEYVDSGSLKILLNEGYTFEESELKDLIYQIGSGLQHVHGNKLIHRDLAARNILLAKTGASGYVFKISDFGMSRVVEGEQQQGNTATTLGPVPWMAPEAIANLEYSPASDAWSFGVLIWEVVTGLDPAQQMPMVDLAVAIRDRGYHPRIPPFIPEYLQTILRGLWTVDAKKRMTIQQVLKILENASGGAAPKGGASSSGYANAGGVMSPGTTPMAALKTPQAALPGSKKDDPRARSKFESSSLQAKVETLERKLADASAENEHLRTMLVQAGVLQSKNSPVPGYSGIADTDKTKKSKKSNKKKGKTETNYESIEMAPMAEKPQPQPQQQQPPQQELGASVFGRDWRKSFVPGQLSNV